MSNLSRTFGPHTVTAGVDLTAGEMDGTDYYKTISYFATDAGKIWTVGPFIQDQIRLFNDKLIIVGGLRYDNATTYEGFTNSNIPSMLDGSVGLILASTHGAGVILSFVPVVLYQGLLTVCARGTHVAFEKILNKMEGKSFRTPSEETELREIKKKKLAGKTRIETLLRKYRKAEDK